MEMKKYYENPHSFSVNTAGQLPLLPYALAEDALAGGPFSRTVTPLSQNWAHYVFASLEEIEPDIFSQQIPLREFTPRSLPFSVAQTPFHFMIDPPYLPAAFGVQVFAKNLNVTRTDDGYTRWLTLAGCYNGCYVYINGRSVGFHGQSGATAAFDCTPYLVNGSNRLVLVVPALSFANYLVPSAQFGILGEVSLISRKAGGVQAVSLTYDLPCHYKTAVLKATVEALCPEEVTVSVYHPNGELLCKAPCRADGTFETVISSPALWSDETPNLYTLLTEFGEEVTRHTFGLRNCSMDESGMTVNGRKTQLKGVIYHPLTVDPSTLEKDLCRMKAHHINTVVLEEFPKKELLALCDRYGLYVMAHSGIHTPYLKDCNHNFAAHDLAFRDITVHRMECLAEESGNPCVIARCVGSDMGIGSNLKFAMDTLRLMDPKTPIFTMDTPKKAGAVVYNRETDLLETGTEDAPAIGWIWGEWQQVLPQLSQIRQQCCPIGVTLENAANGEISIENKNAFTYFSKFQCNYQITRYGEVVEEGMGGIFSLPPAVTEKVQLPYHIPSEGECVLHLTFTYLGDTPYAKDGEKAGEFWFALPTTPRRNAAPVTAPLPELKETENQLHIYAAGCHYTLSTRLGQLIGIEYREKSLLLPYGTPSAEMGCRGVTYTIGENCIIVTAQLKAGKPGLPPLATLTKKFTFYGDGCLAVEPTLTPNHHPLEREWHLPSSLCRVTHYGFGCENTPGDEIPGAYFGRFTANLKEQPLQKVKGKLLQFTNGDGFGIALFHSQTPFTASAKVTEDHLALTLTTGQNFLLKPVEQGEDIHQYYLNTYQSIL